MICRLAITVFITVLCSAAITACGGGDAASEQGAQAPAPPPTLPASPVGAGDLKAVVGLGTVSAASVAQALAQQDADTRGQVPLLVPRYAVTSYRIEYTTSDAAGQPVRASGLVSVPVKPPGSASPLLSYQHGSIFRDAQAPSNNAVSSEIAVVLASLGYIVLAPDYVGFGASRGTPHPYLLSGPSAAAVIDFWSAARTWRSQAGVLDNGQLFLAGYSEGGYVTLATHRALQWSASPWLSTLRLVVPGAGPYNVQATLDGLIDVVRQQQPLLGALIDPGFLKYLGGSAQREVRRALLRLLLPEDTDVAYDTRFLDRFLADDAQAIARDSNVHDWSPALPVRFFHGRDDQTVPYRSATTTLQAMQLRGAASRVSLTDCPAVPASHLGCVAPYLDFLLQQLTPVARDL